MWAISEKSKKIYSIIATILYVVSGIFTIVGGIRSIIGNLSIVKSVIITISVYGWVILGIFLVSNVCVFLLRKKNVVVYPGRNDVPSKFIDTNSRLKYISKKKINMTVIGRTNISWFRDVNAKKELYKDALKNDCEITFILQHEFVESIGVMNENKIEQRQEERMEALQTFEEIRCYLLKEVGESISRKFRLLFTMTPVSNSMTALFKNGYYDFFSYDMGLNIENNPYVMFLNNSVIQELKDKFTRSQENCIDLLEYKSKCEEGKAEIRELLDSYPAFSPQRKNENKKLLYHYFKRKDCIRKRNGEFYPPVSIQLLIASTCTTRCITCDQHEIGGKGELNNEEVRNVIDYICDIGTRNIIISGGEPLSRDKCIEFLEYAKGKGLNVGLLTNGIKHGNVSLTDEDARRISESCKWTQLSIDSFRNDTYKQIRGADLDIVKKSAENLKNAGVNLEIAFNIQKLNIGEAVDLVHENTSPLYNIRVRFKFAHGLNNKNGFLLTTDDESMLREFIASCSKCDCFNSEYIKSMFENGFFTYESIISGKPLTLAKDYINKKKDKCHILDYSCKIAADGEVYPCCYLYDPNEGADSKMRSENSIGALRKEGVDLVPRLSDGENRLKTIWLSEMGRNNENTMPVLQRACCRCTRHFYQNAFMNGLDRIVGNYENYDLRDASYCEEIDSEEIHL